MADDGGDSDNRLAGETYDTTPNIGGGKPGVSVGDRIDRGLNTAAGLAGDVFSSIDRTLSEPEQSEKKPMGWRDYGCCSGCLVAAAATGYGVYKLLHYIDVL